jgi:hypothetical protein
MLDDVELEQLTSEGDDVDIESLPALEAPGDPRSRVISQR